MSQSHQQDRRSAHGVIYSAGAKTSLRRKRQATDPLPVLSHLPSGLTSLAWQSHPSSHTNRNHSTCNTMSVQQAQLLTLAHTIHPPLQSAPWLHFHAF